MGSEVTEKRSRCTHMKSRSGCSNCKKRKVKCNETRPSCRNCSRRRESCEYFDDPIIYNPNIVEPATLSPTPVPAPVPEDGQVTLSLWRTPSLSNVEFGAGNLTLLDLELLHHYSISTCLTLSSDPVARNWFLVNVPQLGFSHPHVLYSVLSLAASHLAHFRPGSRRYYDGETTARHTFATSIAAPLLTDISTSNLVPRYCFSVLTLFISFANLRVEADLALDANDVLPSWLNLFRGMRTVLESNDRVILSSSICFLFKNRPEKSQARGVGILDHDALNELEHHISSRDSEHEQTERHLLDAFQDLKLAFSVFYGYSEEVGNEGRLRSIFTWLYEISDEYIHLLQQHNNDALCIWAFFCVLLHRLEYNWWLKGWGTHSIGRVYTALDEVYLYWIRWPIQEIGWVYDQEADQRL